jgi:hypothetical protein
VLKPACQHGSNSKLSELTGFSPHQGGWKSMQARVDTRLADDWIRIEAEIPQGRRDPVN